MIRSFLFAPAHRRELVLKFPRVSADCFVIDLEDGTPPHERPAAPAGLAALVRDVRASRLSGPLYVRVNEIATEDFVHDMDVAAPTEIDGLVLPKIERPDQVDALLSAADDRRPQGAVPLAMIGGIESMEGVLNVRDLVDGRGRMAAVYFGAEDFALEMGLERTAAGDEVLYARSRVVLAARSRGIPAIDQAVPDVRDEEQLRRDGMRGRQFGYGGKICVTPRQVEICNEIFSPSAGEVARATALIAEVEASSARGQSTFLLDGKMILSDGPMVRRARLILDRARRIQDLRG